MVLDGYSVGGDTNQVLIPAIVILISLSMAVLLAWLWLLVRAMTYGTR